MALTLPTAPANFYAPSLDTLKSKLVKVNGSTKGQVIILSGVPNNIDSCWAEVGAAGNTEGITNRGTLCIGNKDIVAITGPVLGPEESVGENGYKLQFDAVDKIPIYIDGSGSTTSKIMGVAVIEGIDAFANGINDMVRYIFKVNELLITDGSYVNLPKLEVIINYSENDYITNEVVALEEG